MRTFAHYDSAGNIRALITVEARQGTIAMPTPSPGLFVAEVDGLRLDEPKLRSGTRDLVETLRGIARSHKVDEPLPRCTLTRKD